MEQSPSPEYYKTLRFITVFTTDLSILFERQASTVNARPIRILIKHGNILRTNKCLADNNDGWFGNLKHTTYLL
jgi:hypothetical protein